MGYTIAVTGKGGTGKTTVAGLIVAGLLRRGLSPVLAVDADPNSCLDGVLGVRAVKTVGRVREEARAEAASGAVSGIAKREWLELKIAESLVEARGFDLIAMGRPEGPGCYCYANNVLRDVLNEVSRNYPYVVIDNEAGLENVSRRIVQKINLLIITADPSRRGIETVDRLYDLAHEMKITFNKLAVIVNRLRPGAVQADFDEIKIRTRADYVIRLPEDDTLADWAERGESLISLPRENAVAREIDMFLEDIISAQGAQ